jgi:sugar phosphate isomerase/epimerase
MSGAVRYLLHLLGTAVGKDNFKVMIDTYHMNIEEDSIAAAIKTAGNYLGHFHLGEAEMDNEARRSLVYQKDF